MAAGAGLLSNPAHRDRNIAAAVTSEQLVSNPTLATIIGTLTTHTVGTGLNLDARVDGAAIGLTEDETHALNETIEKRWTQYAQNPLECDLSGRFTVHDLASCAFISWLTTGETLAAVDWRRSKDAETGTKLALLEPRQIDLRTQSEPAGFNTFQGVSFDARGRIDALWLRRVALGDSFKPGDSQRYPMRTSWGRAKLHFGLELLFPGQIRGLSPIVAALAPSQDRLMTQELMVASQALQASYAISLKSELPPANALSSLAVSDEASGAASTLGMREEWYSKAPIKVSPGVINVLAPGDKLRFNRPDALTSAYDPFNKALIREAARAAGAMVEDISGDFSQTSFSASRLATELPHRITLRRRKMIVERFYRSIFEAWLEEQIERGLIETPPHARPFWQCRNAYCQSVWLGQGRVEADRKKSAEATILELDAGLTTYGDALAERGISFEEMLERRQAEHKALKASGLLGESIFVGKVSTNVVAAEDAVDGDEAPKAPAKEESITWESQNEE